MFNPESFRDEAGKTEILSTILPFLLSPDMATRLQIFRAVGNLCIDNGKSDSGFDKILIGILMK